jgi:hypothetical protein
VVDKFSKYNNFLPLLHPFTAAKVASVFLDQVYKLHGLPLAIISDRDRIFISHFWQELFRLAGVTLQMSSAYHPQTDGQTERVNQCLETFIHCFVHAYPKQWSRWLSLVEFWYNTCYHSTLDRSPFEVLYGHSLRHFDIQSDEVCRETELSTCLHERQVIKQHLLRAQQRMKVQANKNMSEIVFQVGDQVFLKLQPYVQSSLVKTTSVQWHTCSIFHLIVLCTLSFMFPN